jgi:heme-degrading monooxygenase HmoA
MSVIMTMRVSGDPARFEETVAAKAEAIGRIMDVAKRNGLIAHRWYGSDGEYMAVDEWPDEESFQAFMEQAQPDIGPVMEAAGVTSQPSVTFWRTLDTGAAVGWGA